MKKFFKIFGITLLILLALAFIIPVVFKKQIQALVKKEINKSLDATVDFSDVKLSLFRHFPKVGIVIKDLVIIGKDEFAGDTLIAAKSIDGSAGLFSVLKGKNIKVSDIIIESPRIHARVTEEGRMNWDIAKASSDTSNSTDTSASAFKMTLKSYEINNGYLLYNDEKANTYLELEGLDHDGSGDLTADVFTLATNTKATSASLTQDGIPYLLNTVTDIETDIKIDNKTQTYTFKTEDIVLNNLKLSADGFIQMENDSTFNMDIKFQSPSNDFKDILSMIPDMYTQEFDKIKTSGKATFNGFVKGKMTPQQTPAYDVNLEVKDGSFQYPDLPKPVKNIKLSLRALNPDGNPDNAVIDIPYGHFEMDNEPFDFRFIYSKPVTAQLIDVAAKGKLDLSQLSKFIKLETGTKLSGLLWADAFAKGPMKALQNQSGAFTAGGFFDIKNLFYSASSFPQPIKNGNIKATLQNSGGIADNTTINVSSGHIEVGNDPVDFTLQLSNPVSAINFAGTAKGRFTLDNIKQFTTLEPGTAISGVLNADMGFAGNKKAIDEKQYDKITLTGTAGLANVEYKSSEYPTGVNIAGTQLSFNQQNVTLSNLKGNYLTTNFTANGVLNNLIGYAMQGQPLSGNLNVNADKLNLNDWMGTPATNAPAVTEATTTVSNSSGKPFLVPPAINFTIKANADNVKYDKVDYRNVNGTMVMNDEKITFQNVKTDALDGTLLLNGSYSTKLDKNKPDIGLTYDIKNIDVQKIFQSFNSIQSLMPIGKFLAGKLTSQMSFTGKLNGSMMPVMSSLTGNGNLFLLEGLLAKFAPLEKLAAVLQIDRLKSISLKEVKQFFEFANGKVMVKPFNISIEGIDMQIGGFHGFDQSIDYAIQMKLPRSLMGTKGNSFVNNLAAQANNKGIPIKLGETVNLSVKMTGSISNPSIGINLKEIAGDAIEDLKDQAKDFAQAKLDSAKAKVKDSLEAVKKQVTDKLKDKLKDKIFGKDTTTAPVNNPQDTSKKKDESTIKKTLKGILNRNKKPVTDTTKQ